MRLETERLILRDWRDGDIDGLAAMIADPEVRRYFPQRGTREDAVDAVARQNAALAEFGYAFLAADRKADGHFLGMIGMLPISDNIRLLLPGAPAVEIGWQLCRDCWGEGYAPEGAQAMLDHAWRVLRLPEVAAITYRGNQPSRRVMEKLGMRHDPTGDFEHPAIEAGHPLRPHVLYRIANPALRD